MQKGLKINNSKPPHPLTIKNLQLLSVYWHSTSPDFPQNETKRLHQQISLLIQIVDWAFNEKPILNLIPHIPHNSGRLRMDL